MLARQQGSSSLILYKVVLEYLKANYNAAIAGQQIKMTRAAVMNYV